MEGCELLDMFFLVSEKYKFVIGWSAKCGCSSLKRWYLKLHDVDAPNNMTHQVVGYGDTAYSNVDWRRKGYLADFKKYAIVRNPYSRLVSGFTNKYVNERMPTNGWNSFREFVEVLHKDRYFRKVDKHHFTPQFSEAYESFSKKGMVFDKVIDVGDMQQGLSEISTELSIPRVVVPHVNRTSYREAGEINMISISEMTIKELQAIEHMPSYEHFYNQHALNSVREIYGKDFSELRRYGIEYPTPELLDS